MAKSSTSDTPEPAGNSTEFSPVAPAPSEYTGQYVNRNDSKTYGLCVKPDDHLGRTHKALSPKTDDHPGLFWEGTADQFRLTFDKV